MTNGADISGATSAIGTEYLAALTLALSAERKAEELAPAFEPAERTVKEAQDHYDALKTPRTEVYGLALTADFATGMTAQVQIKYVDPGSNWQAQYDLKLSQVGSEGRVELVRKALIQISSQDERWNGVKVALSSALISRNTQVDDPFAKIGVLQDHPKERDLSLSKSAGADSYSTAVMEPVVMAEQAGVSPTMRGQVLEFAVPGLVSTASDDGIEVAEIDSFTLNVDLTAKVVSWRQQAAYLIATLKNTTGGPLLPGSIAIFRDGVYLGDGNMPAIGIGEEIELSFGEYDGIEVRRDQVEKVDGDIGIITSSNRRVLRHRTTITSHLDFDIPVRVMDSIPVSEQEDLKIIMQARPQPTEQNVKGQRGVMAWQMPLAAGASIQIEFGFEAQWPAGKDFVIQ